MKSRRLAWYSYLLLIAAVTLSPGQPNPAGSVNRRPLDTIRRYLSSPDHWSAIIQLLGNVIIFIPFGMIGPLFWPALFRTWPRAIATAVVFSSLIELLQFALPLDRSTDIDDVILNVLGVLIGYSVWRWRSASRG